MKTWQGDKLLVDYFGDGIVKIWVREKFIECKFDELRKFVNHVSGVSKETGKSENKHEERICKLEELTKVGASKTLRDSLATLTGMVHELEKMHSVMGAVKMPKSKNPVKPPPVPETELGIPIAYWKSVQKTWHVPDEVREKHIEKSAMLINREIMKRIKDVDGYLRVLSNYGLGSTHGQALVNAKYEINHLIENYGILSDD